MNEAMSNQRYYFDEYGQRLYRCFKCRDAGWIHPLKSDGKPDYSKVVKCSCRQESNERKDHGKGNYGSTLW